MNKLSTKGDWLTLLYTIIDGRLDYEIERIGSSTSFLKDCCYATGTAENSQGLLENAIRALIAKKQFSVEELLNRPEVYEYILNWTEAFIFQSNSAWLRFYGLFKRLLTYNQPLDENTKDVSTFFVQRIGEALLNKFTILQNEYAFQERSNLSHHVLYAQKQDFVKSMQLILNDPKNNHLVWLWLGIRTLADLRAWETIAGKSSKELIEFISMDVGSSIRSALIDKLANTPNDNKSDYGLIVDDCQQYSTPIYNQIEQYAAHWLINRSNESSVGGDIGIFDTYKETRFDELFKITRGGESLYKQERFALSNN